MSESNDELKKHYENINSDIRAEIRQRISQRDTYSIQLIFTIGVLLAIAFGTDEYNKVIIVVPLFSIYYTMLILYSYKMHKNLTVYLVYELYPKISSLYDGMPIKSEWEIFHQRTQGKPGIRQLFFKISMPVLCILSGIYIFSNFWNESKFRNLAVVAYAFYIVLIYILLFVIFKSNPSGVHRSYPKYKKRRVKNKHKSIAVFLDRDGTINEDKHFPYKIKDLVIPNVSFEALRLLKENGFKVIVITNQSGVSLGKYTKRQMARFNKKLVKRVKANHGIINAIYYSTDIEPTHVDNEELSNAKPSPAMIHLAQAQYNIDLENSFLIGDKKSDIETGHRAGLYSFLVKTGKAGNDDFYKECRPDAEVDNILVAVKRILEIKASE